MYEKDDVQTYTIDFQKISTSSIVAAFLWLHIPFYKIITISLQVLR